MEQNRPVAQKPQQESTKSFNLTFIVTILFALCFIITVVAGAMLFRFLSNTAKTLPAPQELAYIQPSLVTRIYAADSSLLHEFSIERRFWKPLDSISPHLVNALVAIEDRRFYSHWGIDPRRIFSAAIGNVISRGYNQGASTLTQQLARNLYFTHQKTMMRKVREILTAIQLEDYYSKDEIMELYLNMVYLGGGVYGAEAASQKYFSKSAKELTINESAVLAGLIQRPEGFRPDRKNNLERITARRNIVLLMMERAGFIDQTTKEIESAQDIPVNPQLKIASKAPYYVEHIRQHLENTYGTDVLYNGGLKIYTTLDPTAQDSTEVALTNHIDSLQRVPNAVFLQGNRLWRKIGVPYDTMLTYFDSLYEENKELFVDLPDSLKHRRLEASAIAMDAHTGAVRVLIGGRDFHKSRFNRALQSIRQPGSAIKPFVYAAAIESGLTPATVIIDKPITLQTEEGPWRPENYSHKFYGPISMRDALRRSVNLVAIQVLQDVTAPKVIDFCRRTGMSHNLPPVPALAIGAAEASNVEITAAYATFANGGYKIKPYFIEQVLDKHGRVLEEHEDFSEKIMEPGVASTMASMLGDVINRGTGVDVRRMGFRRPAGGKTGTTNNYSDAWFVGFTPQLSCGVWVGVDERRSMGYGMTGSKGGVPIWVAAMKSLHRDIEPTTFDSTGVTRHEICAISHMSATRYCPQVYQDIFMEDRTPKLCSEHGRGQARDSSNIIDYFGSGLGGSEFIHDDDEEKPKHSSTPVDTTFDDEDEGQLLF